MSKKAFVISGGGSAGAWAVGVADYLVNVKKTQFDIFAGSSTGSLISSLMITGEIDLLKKIYTSVKTGDIIKQRCIITALLFNNSLYSTKPLEKLIKKYIDDERTGKILNSHRQMFLTTVSLQTLSPVYFKSGPETTDKDDTVVHIKNKEMLQKALLASSNQPGLMPPVQINTGLRNDQYVDGGVREIAPLKIAIDNGAEEIYCVILSPDKHAADNKDFNKIFDILVRTLSGIVEELTDSDLHTAEIYNSGILLIDAMHKGFVDTGKITKEEFNQILHSVKNPFITKKLKKIHIIRPLEELPSGSQGLEFKPEVMKKMMEMGYQRAKEIFGN